MQTCGVLGQSDGNLVDSWLGAASWSVGGQGHITCPPLISVLFGEKAEPKAGDGEKMV